MLNEIWTCRHSIKLYYIHPSFHPLNLTHPPNHPKFFNFSNSISQKLSFGPFPHCITTFCLSLHQRIPPTPSLCYVIYEQPHCNNFLTIWNFFTNLPILSLSTEFQHPTNNIQNIFNSNFETGQTSLINFTKTVGIQNLTIQNPESFKIWMFLFPVFWMATWPFKVFI